MPNASLETAAVVANKSANHQASLPNTESPRTLEQRTPTGESRIDGMFAAATPTQPAASQFTSKQLDRFVAQPIEAQIKEFCGYPNEQQLSLYKSLSDREQFGLRLMMVRSPSSEEQHITALNNIFASLSLDKKVDLLNRVQMHTDDGATATGWIGAELLKSLNAKDQEIIKAKLSPLTLEIISAERPAKLDANATPSLAPGSQMSEILKKWGKCSDRDTEFVRAQLKQGFQLGEDLNPRLIYQIGVGKESAVISDQAAGYIEVKRGRNVVANVPFSVSYNPESKITKFQMADGKLDINQIDKVLNFASNAVEGLNKKYSGMAFASHFVENGKMIIVGQNRSQDEYKLFELESGKFKEVALDRVSSVRKDGTLGMTTQSKDYYSVPGGLTGFPIVQFRAASDKRPLQY